MKQSPLTVLQELRFGALMDEFGDKLAEVVKAVTDTGKAGEITLKLTIKPAASGSVEVHDDVKTKVPEHPRESSVRFPTVDGDLVRNDPRQQELTGLRSVDEVQRDVKEA